MDAILAQSLGLTLPDFGMLVICACFGLFTVFMFVVSRACK
jgi:hypothetical protein